MKTLQLLLLALAAMTLPARADIEVRISVKFILNWDGTRPVNAGNIDLSTAAAFDVEIAHGNQVLSATGRGYRLRVVEYIDVQPMAPVGQSPDYWYNLPARSNRRVIEDAAAADSATWRRNGAGALNIYVNNSSSGSCSFIGTGDSISLGSTVFTRGTVVHEIGHFFDLSHTHAGDSDCSDPPPYALADGDRLSETVPDSSCYSTRAALMAALLPELQAAVDTSWLNVMSYHQEEQLLDIQMDYWSSNANHARHAVCTGYTWFLATDHLDGISDGLSTGQAFQTVEWARLFVTTPDDILLLKTGAYAAPEPLDTPCTLRATGGPVTLFR